MDSNTVKFIREYWSTYYKNNEKLELLSRRQNKMVKMIMDFELKHSEWSNTILFIKEGILEFAKRKQEFYNHFVEKYSETMQKMESLQNEMEEKENGFKEFLNHHGLQLEQRDYSEELYNVVNGLEDDLYEK